MDLPKLNLPKFEFRYKKQNDKLYIFDAFRNKFVVLTPEEWVRQNILEFLVQEKGYPRLWIAVEKEININGLKRRYDALVYNKNEDVLLLIELKAPKIKINEKVFNQISAYNYSLNAPYLLVSNGISHYYAKVDLKQKTYEFLSEIPSFQAI